ncbi:SanA/YdcF family protein [Frigoriflavimonas asaccharolytica]|uniref:SanA protein n=1 Tax=Frigoriflavimonas asaccharolytica TaxID=2735899 RepID=A0A8J8K6Y8_9FLAO|nr:ElyC/SanA/YdcF family protein [Frigoriflavimonas asaccharolytica]NRS90961.1 SanA protein [Frigoriflavimonas asaccharolytica]
MKVLKKLFYTSIIFIIISILAILWCNYTIESNTETFLTSSISKVPAEKAGLLLGTSKNLANGTINPYFKYRIEAAAELFLAGKIQNIIVSGDNSVKHYNETEDMKFALIEKGVPENKIFEDFAGFRTLDSVVRAKEIFGQNSLIIISQKFHNERAIYLAQKNGMNAFGYNAKDVNSQFGFTTNVREKLARVKVFVDLIFGVEPKFGGEKIIIP